MLKLVAVLFFACLLNPLPVLADGLKSFEDKDTGLFGFKDSKGQVIIKPQFQTVLSSASKDALISVLKSGKWYRMDSKGKLKFESVWFDNGPDYYEQDLARFIRARKIGFHDYKGNVVIDATYDFAMPFKKGRAFVCNECWAVYETNTKFHPASSSSCASPIESAHTSVTGGKWGAIDLKGKLIIPLIYSSMEEAEKPRTGDKTIPNREKR